MQLYFVAIQIPPPLDSEIRKFQQEMADEYNSSRQLRIPTHITLIPPFRFESKEKVLDAFEKAISELSFKSTIALNGFGQFREKVLFVNIEPNEELNAFRHKVFHSILEELSIKWPEYQNNFHPHITIANRDLSYNDFNKAWPIFRDRPYSRKFNNIEIVLYKHINGIWKVQSSKIISE